MDNPGPYDPLTSRQELISALECHGFDIGHDAPADWRETMSLGELCAAVAVLDAEVA